MHGKNVTKLLNEFNEFLFLEVGLIPDKKNSRKTIRYVLCIILKQTFFYFSFSILGYDMKRIHDKTSMF